MKPGEWLAHPSDKNNFSFGFVPEIKSRGVLIPEGYIRLKHGRHRGPNRGFGVAHIWAEHRQEMEAAGYDKVEQVPHYVADIIRTGSPILCEFANLREFQRLTVV